MCELCLVVVGVLVIVGCELCGNFKLGWKECVG